MTETEFETQSQTHPPGEEEVLTVESPMEIPPEDADDLLEAPFPEEETAPPPEATEPPAEKTLVSSPASGRRAILVSKQEREVLTIEPDGTVQTPQSREELVWYELRNSYITHRVLTGTLSGVEQMANNRNVAVLDFKGQRILIPLKEMMVRLPQQYEGETKEQRTVRKIRLLSAMLGAQIDFLVRGMEPKSRTVVASRKDAILRRRQTFYFDITATGKTHIYEGRIVQARILSVTEKSIWVDIFGVECPILARDLSKHWIGDLRDHYCVGDTVLVRVTHLEGETCETLKINADARSLTQDNYDEILQQCKVQSTYAAEVTDVRHGAVFLRLSNGANAIAHTCMDRRMPGKKDQVSFVVTRIDMERGFAYGLISRIIRQNL